MWLAAIMLFRGCSLANRVLRDMAYAVVVIVVLWAVDVAVPELVAHRELGVMEEAVVEAARGDVRTTRVVALVPVAVQEGDVVDPGLIVL